MSPPATNSRLGCCLPVDVFQGQTSANSEGGRSGIGQSQPFIATLFEVAA
jgi:hypothetical protein